MSNFTPTRILTSYYFDGHEINFLMAKSAIKCLTDWFFESVTKVKKKSTRFLRKPTIPRYLVARSIFK